MKPEVRAEDLRAGRRPHGSRKASNGSAVLLLTQPAHRCATYSEDAEGRGAREDQLPKCQAPLGGHPLSF